MKRGIAVSLAIGCFVLGAIIGLGVGVQLGYDTQTRERQLDK
jgi:hypothetical protein